METEIADVHSLPHTQSVASALGIITSCFGFVLIGALQALYGPMIPYLIEKFSISPSVAGMSLSAHFAGALIGVLLFHKIYSKVSNRIFLGAAYTLMSLGCIIFCYASNWSIALIGTFIIGLGFGGNDFGLNFLFSTGFGKRSTSMVNLLNAHFGVGAIVGPVIVGWFGAENYQSIFLIFAICSLLPVLFLHQMVSRLQEGRQSVQSNTGRLRVAALIIAFFVIYIFHVAIETGVGGWEPTHLEAIGYSAVFAATATSFYWGALTAGRFLACWIGRYWTSERMMLVSCIGMTISLACAAFPSMSVLAYIGVGLFIAPIFPTGLAWLNHILPQSRAVTAYVIAASMIGGVLFPPLIGMFIHLFGVVSAPLFMAILSFFCICATWAIIRRNE